MLPTVRCITGQLKAILKALLVLLVLKELRVLRDQSVIRVLQVQLVLKDRKAILEILA
jgi:hypothetical protein